MSIDGYKNSELKNISFGGADVIIIIAQLLFGVVKKMSILPVLTGDIQSLGFRKYKCRREFCGESGTDLINKKY